MALFVRKIVAPPPSQHCIYDEKGMDTLRSSTALRFRALAFGFFSFLLYPTGKKKMYTVTQFVHTYN